MAEACLFKKSAVLVTFVEAQPLVNGLTRGTPCPVYGHGPRGGHDFMHAVHAPARDSRYTYT